MLTELARRAEELKGEIEGALLLAPETPAADACDNVRKLLEKTHTLMEEVRTCAAYQVCEEGERTEAHPHGRSQNLRRVSGM